MSVDTRRDHNLPNMHGIYHGQYKTGNKNVHCYYACEPGQEYVYAPPQGKRWFDSIPSIPELQKECEAIAPSTRTMLREFPHDVIHIVSAARHLAAEERPRKRTRVLEDSYYK